MAVGGMGAVGAVGVVGGPALSGVPGQLSVLCNKQTLALQGLFELRVLKPLYCL